MIKQLRGTASQFALMLGIRAYGDKPMQPVRPWTATETLDMLGDLAVLLQYEREVRNG
jgi:hypothetical protein